MLSQLLGLVAIAGSMHINSAANIVLQGDRVRLAHTSALAVFLCVGSYCPTTARAAIATTSVVDAYGNCINADWGGTPSAQEFFTYHVFPGGYATADVLLDHYPAPTQAVGGSELTPSISDFDLTTNGSCGGVQGYYSTVSTAATIPSGPTGQAENSTPIGIWTLSVSIANMSGQTTVGPDITSIARFAAANYFDLSVAGGDDLVHEETEAFLQTIGDGYTWGDYVSSNLVWPTWSGPVFANDVYVLSMATVQEGASVETSSVMGGTELKLRFTIETDVPGMQSALSQVVPEPASASLVFVAGLLLARKPGSCTGKSRSA